MLGAGAGGAEISKAAFPDGLFCPSLQAMECMAVYVLRGQSESFLRGTPVSQGAWPDCPRSHPALRVYKT